MAAAAIVPGAPFRLTPRKPRRYGARPPADRGKGSRSIMGARWLGVVTFAALCALLAPPASAGVNIWTGTGPEGGTISNLAIDPAVPSTMYAGGDAGIFRSTNGGRSWSAVAVPSSCSLLPELAV